MLFRMNPATVNQNPNDPTTQDPVLDQGVLSANQVPGSPNYGTAAGNLVPASVKFTAAIYEASRPTPVQALLKLSTLAQPANPQGPTADQVANSAPRYAQALALAMQGFTIDVEIDALGYDPVVTMLLRQEMGIPWVAPMGSASPQPTPTNPAPWPATLPAGWIKTSLNPADYPAIAPPTPPPASSAIVGTLVGTMPPGVLPYLPKGGTIFRAGPGAFAAYSAGTLVNGASFTDPSTGMSYGVQIGFGLMGVSITFYISN